MTKDNYSTSQKESRNTENIHSTNNGILKSIIGSPSEAVIKTIAAVGGPSAAAASLPGGILPGGALVGAALSLLKQNNKSMDKPDTAAMDTQSKI